MSDKRQWRDGIYLKILARPFAQLTTFCGLPLRNAETLSIVVPSKRPFEDFG